MKWDITTKCDDGKLYCRRFILWPKQWKKFSSTLSLSWNSIQYNKTNLTLLPVEMGVYAFVVKPEIAGLTECNYLMYIGKAQKQTLKIRCAQYLNELTKSKPRLQIVQMLDHWKPHLHLYYSVLDSDKVDISLVEDELLAAFLPPMNTKLPGKLQTITEGIYR